MGNKNYSNFSKHFKKQNKNNNASENVVVENTEVIEGQISIDEIVNEQVESVEAIIPVIGFVSGCDKLNMRKEPNKNSAVLTILHKHTELQVDEVNSTEEFYKVTTTSGVEGYCMKKFISVR